MGSKKILLLGLSFAIVLLICSEVAARDLAEQTSIVSNDIKSVKETNGVGKAKYDACDDRFCHFGCCGPDHCCRAAGDLAEQTSIVSNDITESVKETNGVGKAKYDACDDRLCPFGCCGPDHCCRVADV